MQGVAGRLAPQGIEGRGQTVLLFDFHQLFVDLLEEGPVGILRLGYPLVFVAVDERRGRPGDGKKPFAEHLDCLDFLVLVG